MTGRIYRDGVGRVIDVPVEWFSSFDPNQVATSDTAISQPFSDPLRTTHYDFFGRVNLTGLDTHNNQRLEYHPFSVTRYSGENIAPGSPTYDTVSYDGYGQWAGTINVVGGGAFGTGADIRYSQAVNTNVFGEPRYIWRSSQALQEGVGRYMSYDSFGRMVSNYEQNISGQNGIPFTYVWDEFGNLVGTSDSRGCGGNMFYDADGRLLAELFAVHRRAGRSHRSESGDGRRN